MQVKNQAVSVNNHRSTRVELQLSGLSNLANPYAKTSLHNANLSLLSPEVGMFTVLDHSESTGPATLSRCAGSHDHATLAPLLTPIMLLQSCLV